ncbi:MAG: GumC family protein [Cognatishimia sp.]
MAFQSDIIKTPPNADFLPRFDRILRKKRPGQAGYLLQRLTRYSGVFLVWAALIWTPIVGYLTSTPPSYTSHLSLILPGAGVSASVNIDNIGQASSYANSAFASNSISPTQTYKRLLRADRILDAAATTLEVPRNALPRPKVDLVDQTSLIHLEMTGGSPQQAKDRAQAVLDAFFTEITALRTDDQLVREEGALIAIEEYRDSVQATRSAVTSLQNETGFLSRDQFSAQVTENDTRYTTLIDLRAQLEDKTAYVQALETALGLSPETAARALDLYSDRQYLALVQEAADKAAALSQASSRYGARHPRMIESQAAYDEAQNATFVKATAVTGLTPAQAAQLNLSQFGDRTTLLAELVRNEAERAGMDAQYNTLNRRFSREKNRLERAAQAAAQLEDLQRDFQVAEAVFASAIARGQSSKVDVFASYPLVQVLENPSLPDGPSSPRTKIALFAGMAATLMVIMGLSLGWVRRGLINWLIGMRKDQENV